MVNMCFKEILSLWHIKQNADLDDPFLCKHNGVQQILNIIFISHNFLKKKLGTGIPLRI